MMARYWYSLTPLVVISTVPLLALPWLGFIVLMLFALIAAGMLGALVVGVVLVPQTLFISVDRRWRSRNDAVLQPATPPSPRRRLGTPQSMPIAGAAFVPVRRPNPKG